MVRKILEWIDDEADELSEAPEEEHPYLKAIGLGGLEWFIDGAFIASAGLIASAVIDSICKKKK